MRILIGADLVPTGTNADLFIKGKALELVGEELLTLLQSADYRIFNLEVPLADSSVPFEKNGPALMASTQTVYGYKALGADLLTVANNHILDQNVQGLASTLRVLQENGISFVGAGKNLQEAAKPYIIENAGQKIGVYACAEHEFSIAQENKPGANPFDPLESLDHVTALKSQCDYVVVLYHGGKEHYRYPSPMLQKTCQKLVEKGADLVVCQHSHCIGCEEKYLNGTIVYGQGNFLFDHSESEFWKTGLLIQLENDFTVSYIPVVKRGNVVRLASADQADKIMAAFCERSSLIQKQGKVEELYARFAREMLPYYLISLSSVNNKSFFFRAMNRLTGARWGTWLMKRKYKQAKRLRIYNYTQCEAHRELLLRGLKGDSCSE